LRQNIALKAIMLSGLPDIGRGMKIDPILFGSVECGGMFHPITNGYPAIGAKRPEDSNTSADSGPAIKLPKLDTSPKQPGSPLTPPNVSSGSKSEPSIDPAKAPKPDGGKKGSGGENSGKGKKKDK
jgi:hypothetical protein